MRPLALTGLVLLAAGCDALAADSLLADFEALAGCPVRGVGASGTASGTLDDDCTGRDVLLSNFSGGELDAFPVDFYVVEVDEPAQVQIDLTSNDFDTTLGLYDDTGRFLEGDDDDGLDTNARIVRDLDAGAYLILATAFRADQSGRYTLSVERRTP